MIQFSRIINNYVAHNSIEMGFDRKVLKRYLYSKQFPDFLTHTMIVIYSIYIVMYINMILCIHIMYIIVSL